MYVLHDHEVSIVELAEVVGADDIWVFKGCCNSCLVEEKSLINVVPPMLGQEPFEYDKASKSSETTPLYQEDFGHSSFRKFL